MKARVITTAYISRAVSHAFLPFWALYKIPYKTITDNGRNDELIADVRDDLSSPIYQHGRVQPAESSRDP